MSYNLQVTLKIYTDGGSKGNPGPAAIGIIAFLGNNKEVFRYREDIGIATNNTAEYKAVIKALEIVIEKNLQFSIIEFYSDSQLLVRQLNGLYKVRHEMIKEYIKTIQALIAKINRSISFTYIPREKNTQADALVNGLNP